MHEFRYRRAMIKPGPAEPPDDDELAAARAEMQFAWDATRTAELETQRAWSEYNRTWDAHNHAETDEARARTTFEIARETFDAIVEVRRTRTAFEIASVDMPEYKAWHRARVELERTQMQWERASEGEPEYEDWRDAVAAQRKIKAKSAPPQAPR